MAVDVGGKSRQAKTRRSMGIRDADRGAGVGSINGRVVSRGVCSVQSVYAVCKRNLELCEM